MKVAYYCATVDFLTRGSEGLISAWLTVSAVIQLLGLSRSECSLHPLSSCVRSIKNKETATLGRFTELNDSVLLFYCCDAFDATDVEWARIAMGLSHFPSPECSRGNIAQIVSQVASESGLSKVQVSARVCMSCIFVNRRSAVAA